MQSYSLMEYNFELFKFVAQCTKCIMEELCTGCQNAPNNRLFDIVTTATCVILMQNKEEINFVEEEINFVEKKKKKHFL